MQMGFVLGGCALLETILAEPPLYGAYLGRHPVWEKKGLKLDSIALLCWTTPLLLLLRVQGEGTRDLKRSSDPSACDGGGLGRHDGDGGEIRCPAPSHVLGGPLICRKIGGVAGWAPP